MVALVLAIVPAGASQFASAQAGAPVLNEPYDGFSNVCRQRIVFRPIWRVSLATVDADDVALIVLNPILRLPAENARFDFLATHECAHHLLGHMDPASLRERATLPGVLAQQELAADCWAAQFMTRLNQVASIRVMAERLYRRGARSPDGLYPSGEARARRILACIRAAERQ